MYMEMKEALFVSVDEYRPLSSDEIGQLVVQSCYCDDWSRIRVHPEFQPEYVVQTRFSGDIKIGRFEEEITLYGGIKFHTGIYNATLHNCSVGDNSFIHNIKSYIANYEIGDGVKIENTKTIAVEGRSSFGNGTRVNVINEGGGRSIPIYDHLSTHVAYMMAMYRHRPVLIKELEELVDNYSNEIESEMGRIEDGASIINCDSIKNVHIGPYAQLEGVSKLFNGSINSSEEDPVIIGDSVIMEDFIICSGSTVKDASLVANCFIGQGCVLDKHYSAVHSVFSANCQGIHGEACSIFAGPYTVSHHKSSLLIAGFFSFLNAGSGSNQSNHMYKLGPIHQGVVERGSKTTSDSYLLWPSKIGAFTLVMGRHYQHADTSDFPFSYLIENSNDSHLVPGVNLSSIGTVRDSQKWPRRDRRKDPIKLDYINFNLLSPYTIHKMMKGREMLNRLKTKYPAKEFINHEGMVIASKNVERGIQLYEMAIKKFLGNSMITRITSRNVESLEELQEALQTDTPIGIGNWTDLSGLFAPTDAVEQLLNQIEEGKVDSTESLDKRIRSFHENYYSYEWTWVYQCFKDFYKIDIAKITPGQIVKVIEAWKEAVLGIDEMLLNDSQKEFGDIKQIGFGVDGDSDSRQADFDSVRNAQSEAKSTRDSILNHMKTKEKLGNSVIELVKKLN